MKAIMMQKLAFGLIVAAGLSVTGCQSKEQEAIATAKQQAAATGQAQQVISTDKNGNTVTTTVQPPAAGQVGQVVTTTVTPKAAPVVANGNGTQNDAATQAAAVQGGGAAAAPANGNPIIRPADVNVPAGTNLAIRINQRISVKSSREGDRFDGEFVEPVLAQNGRVIVPKGTPVGGVVDYSHQRGHFKGRSLLELRLTSMTLNGISYPLETHDLARGKKGKGKRSAALIGGGAGLGMLIGGVASGGTGLLIGGLAGGGAGTAVSGLTGNRDVVIPSESIVHFKLADDLMLQPA
jgi:hypothetical protein